MSLYKHFKKASSPLISFVLLSSLSCVGFAASQQDICQDNTIFKVGAGIYDITGPAAEQGMFGYGMIGQQTSGISQRLWARAFVIESPCNRKRVVFVNTDLGAVSQGVKQQVVAKLRDKYGVIYGDKNVLITATHTRSGPGGFSTYTFYNLTTLGFNRSNFNTIVDGIVAAVDRAQNNMTKAQMKVAVGQLPGINFNRSPAAYLLNPQRERSLYQNDTDTQMTLLRFDTLDGKPIGMINWFPIHGVSLNNKNRLISGDNKGYAEYLFEKDFHANYDTHSFVAAFAQENAGDVSPNQYGHEGGEGLTGLKLVESAGKAQYEAAKQLFNNATAVVKGGVDYRHEFVAMDNLTISPKYTNGKVQTTCSAAIGVSMLAGTQDGEGVGYQGVTCETISHVIPRFICEMRTTDCQGVKPIALEVGTMTPFPWTPNILPLQVIKLGNVGIAAAPFEVTTMTGRRIRDTVASQLPSSSQSHVVMSTLANAYSGYVATNEEYQLQRYEGASTHFGPWTSAALQQEFAKLTKAIVVDVPVADGPMPNDLSGFQVDVQPGVMFDDKPYSQTFGGVNEDVKRNYYPGDVVQVSFWGGHPKNNFRIQDSFLEIQRMENGKWVTIKRDRDWGVEYRWTRSGIANSLITITWRTDQNELPGQYRIVHRGDWKSGWSRNIYPYIGFSSVFTMR